MPDQPQFACWGAAGHAKVLAELITHNGGRVAALFDSADKPSFLHGVALHVGIQGFHHWLQHYGPVDALCGVVAIGRCGPDRITILRLFQSNGLKTPALVHPSACISPSSRIGQGAQVLALALVAADAVIGEACIVNHRASIDHECTLEEGVHVAPGATLCGCVHVGKNVFVGAGAVVLPRLRIGDHATIGAGAVVTHDVPAGATVVGNPARVV